MGINLVKAEFWLAKLKCFLRDASFSTMQKGISFNAAKLAKMRLWDAEIIPSVEAQCEHKKAARSFCFTSGRRVEQKIAIYTAPEIEMLPHKFICGILLHELGHVILRKRVNNDEEEVEVDAWAVSHGLGYEYNDLRLKDGRTAYSLQHVSRDGVTRIRRAGK